LEIIDIGCNLKQFDGLTWLTLTLTLRSTLLVIVHHTVSVCRFYVRKFFR